MNTHQKYDVCVIGAGAAGLSVAAGAVQLGLKTCLIEKGEMGGDCLNTGCVPSKSLLASAKAAHDIRNAGVLGIHAQTVDVDFKGAKTHLRNVIESIAPHDSQERFESLGVDVIREKARFTNAKTLAAGNHTIRAKYFVIATGGRAHLPDIPGLESDKILTNETIFNLTEYPEHLVIMGGGPIGIEMAQAHRRLGADVTVLDTGRILKHDDRDAVAVIRTRLEAEGIRIIEGAKIDAVQQDENGVTLSAGTQKIAGTHLLVAVGRSPNIEQLDLDAAGIDYSPKGITVDAHLKTSAKNIFAIGDVAGGPLFTHVAGYHAGIIIRQIAFKIFFAKTDYSALPWVTYTDPELAHVGMTHDQALEKYRAGDLKIVKKSFSDNDRAKAEKQTDGFIKVIAHKNGRILGVTIVGPKAGEMIGLWCLAISKKMKMRDVAGIIMPYPTLGEISKHIAGEFYKDNLFSAKTKRVIRWLKFLPF